MEYVMFPFAKVGVIFSFDYFTQAFTNHRACSGIPTTALSVFSQNFYLLILLILKISHLL